MAIYSSCPSNVNPFHHFAHVTCNSLGFILLHFANHGVLQITSLKPYICITFRPNRMGYSGWDATAVIGVSEVLPQIGNYLSICPIFTHYPPLNIHGARKNIVWSVTLPYTSVRNILFIQHMYLCISHKRVRLWWFQTYLWRHTWNK